MSHIEVKLAFFYSYLAMRHNNNVTSTNNLHLHTHTHTALLTDLTCGLCNKVFLLLLTIGCKQRANRTVFLLFFCFR